MHSQGKKESKKKRFILPFAALGASRFKEFTKSMEMASIVYLAESDREKGESQLLKKTDEKIVFITEACYPIWLVPQHTGTTIFDGLGLTSDTLYYDVTPITESFNRDILKNQKTTETYTATLARNTHYFRNFRGKERIEIGGLITATDLKKDFKEYFSHVRELRNNFATSVVLAPTIDAQRIKASVKLISNLRDRTNKDIELMNASMRLLNVTTVRRIKAIREEIRKTKEKYHQGIRKTEHNSTRRMWQIQNQYNRKITRTSKRFKRRLLRLNKNQAKLRKTLGHLKTEAKRCDIRLQSSRRHKRKQAEAQWTLRLRKIKKKLPALSKEFDVNSKRIHNVENAQKRELAKQKVECFTRIESVNKIFRDLQGSREAEIIMKRQEIVTLEDLTRTITKSMHEMVQKKKVSHSEFDKLTIQLGKRTRRLVHIPFYLVRYEKGEKKRYVLYPPSVVGDMGILTKMRGALGAAKVKALVQSRSEPIASFLNQFPKLFEKKPMVEKDVTEDGIRNSLLLKKQLRVGVKKGLKELEKENWISKNELQTVSKLLYIYSSSMNLRTKTMIISENDQLKCLTA